MPKCRHCKTKLGEGEGVRVGLSWYCNNNAAIAWAKQKERDDFEKGCRDDRKEAKQSSKSYQMEQAQKAFNTFIRLRDTGQACISCGTPYPSIKKKNAGHYRSVGAAPHLRFNEDNCHLQTEHCNTHLSGNLIEYRKGLIERIGVERVEALESDNTPRQYRIEDYKAIRTKYNLKSKALERKIDHEHG